jgi:glyoxylase-like metal-dependent hydrolase (beta-lactamase superfamily II)/rhodanese-related sulfurtransferase
LNICGVDHILKALFEHVEASMGARIESFVDEGLGHSSYLVDLGDGTALVVDPARIPTAQRTRAAEEGLRIAYTADTHTHADYISGSPDLAADGAVFLAPAAAELEHDHRGLVDSDEITIGRYRLRAIATPGHTPDHLSHLLLDDGEPAALFSGGSLMVGAVGRTDLLGDECRESLARDLYRALQDRILTLPDDLAVHPTHGAGSFCSAPGGGDRTTTIGRERATNPMLSMSEDDFVTSLVAGLGSFPAYFRRLPELNRRGLLLHDRIPALDPLRVEEVERLIDSGAVVVDARPVTDFAAGHIPGALSVALRGVFASWLGWLVDPDQPVVVVLDTDQDEADLVRQALAIGHDALAGRLDGGMAAWTASGRRVETTELLGPDDLDRPLVDVRQADEFATGHVPGATNVELGRLRDADLPAGSVVTMCGKTERAMTAASVLARRGHRDVAVLHGGWGAWTTRHPTAAP